MNILVTDCKKPKAQVLCGSRHDAGCHALTAVHEVKPEFANPTVLDWMYTQPPPCSALPLTNCTPVNVTSEY